MQLLYLHILQKYMRRKQVLRGRHYYIGNRMIVIKLTVLNRCYLKDLLALSKILPFIVFCFIFVGFLVFGECSSDWHVQYICFSSDLSSYWFFDDWQRTSKRMNTPSHRLSAGTEPFHSLKYLFLGGVVCFYLSVFIFLTLICTHI